MMRDPFQAMAPSCVEPVRTVRPPFRDPDDARRGVGRASSRRLSEEEIR